MNISTLNKISPIGLKHFEDSYDIDKAPLTEADAILVRSQDMLSMEFSPKLKAIARAGAGVNNIPLQRCAEEGIVVFNTPGANANAVKELVLCGLFMAARNVPQALNWASMLSPKTDAEGKRLDVAKQVEKGKSQFAGTEILGKTLAVVGFGAIGRKVAESAYALGMKIVGYDPFYSEKEGDDRFTIVSTIEEAFAEGDYITLHLPANDKTKKMVNKALLDTAKDGAVLLNFSRDKLINFSDLFDALLSKKISKYVTDFPTDDFAAFDENLNPTKNQELLSRLQGSYILLPHLGASTEEAEDNCAVMAVDQIRAFLEHGNIINSVNFPRLDMGQKGKAQRLAIITKDMPNPIFELMEYLSEAGVSAKKTMSVRRDDAIAYTLFELTEGADTTKLKLDDDNIIGYRLI